MKVVLTKDHLRGLLGAVGTAVPSRTTLPILSHVLLEAEGEYLRGTGSDLDLIVRTQVAARVSKPGAICVPLDTIRQIADKISPGDVELELAGAALTIRSGRSRLTVNCLPAEDFPRLKEPDFGDPLLVPAKELFDSIDATAFAVSTETTRPIINGVHWAKNGSELRMVATNGHKLAIASSELPQGAERFFGVNGLIIHPKAFSAVRLITAGAHMIEVAQSDSYLAFRAGGGTVATRTIDGPFPNYEQVVPTDNDKELIAGTAALRLATERVAILASRGENMARVVFSFEQGQSAYVSAELNDRGGGEEEIDTESYEGDPLQIGFNAAYVSELLRKVGTEKVRWTFSRPERATLLEPAEPTTGLQVRYILMPLRILDRVAPLKAGKK